MELTKEFKNSMISITPEAVFYFAFFGFVVIAFGFLVVAFIYYFEYQKRSHPKHKHA
jgi:hypothetical protein